VREVSRAGARFRETAPGFANWIHKHGTAIRDKGPSLRAFRSGGPRHTHFNFQTQSVRELGTFRSQYANQEPTRLRQPIAKTRILTFADSRNLAHRHRWWDETLGRRYLEADHGQRARQSPACSKACAARMRVSSSKCRPTSMAPIGRPLTLPHGTVSAGWPLTSNGQVFCCMLRAAST
jgi:hypothetical protein